MNKWKEVPYVIEHIFEIVSNEITKKDSKRFVTNALGRMVASTLDKTITVKRKNR